MPFSSCSLSGYGAGAGAGGGGSGGGSSVRCLPSPIHSSSSLSHPFGTAGRKSLGNVGPSRSFSPCRVNSAPLDNTPIDTPPGTPSSTHADSLPSSPCSRLYCASGLQQLQRQQMGVDESPKLQRCTTEPSITARTPRRGGEAGVISLPVSPATPLYDACGGRCGGDGGRCGGDGGCTPCSQHSSTSGFTAYRDNSPDSTATSSSTSSLRPPPTVPRPSRRRLSVSNWSLGRKHRGSITSTAANSLALPADDSSRSSTLDRPRKCRAHRKKRCSLCTQDTFREGRSTWFVGPALTFDPAADGYSPTSRTTRRQAPPPPSPTPPTHPSPPPPPPQQSPPQPPQSDFVEYTGIVNPGDEISRL